MISRARVRLAARMAAGLGTSALLVAALAWQQSGAGTPSSELEHQAEVLGKRFLDRYMTADGRVVRHDQGGDTVSEGQAYAMLTAVGLGDRPRFDLAWQWAQAHLQRPDGLLGWHWHEGAVVDPMPATDADLDAAAALSEAADRFDEPRYREEARRLARAVMAQETVVVAGRRQLVAGPWAQNRPYRVNPGYVAPASLVALHGLTADGAWLELDENGRQLLAALTAGGSRLPPDWAVVNEDGSAAPTGRPNEPAAPPEYGLDAGRLLVRLAVDCHPGGRTMAAALWARLQSAPSAGTALASTLDGAPLREGSHPTMHVAASAAAYAAGNSAAGDRLFAQAVELDRRQPSYFSAAWLAVASRQLGTPPPGGCPR